MGTLKFTTHLEATGFGETVEVGSKTTTQSVTVGSAMYQARKVVADDHQEETLWISGDGGFTGFDTCVIESDAEIQVEFRNNLSTAEFVMIGVLANIPLILNVDDTAGGTATAFTGDGVATVSGTDFGQINQVVCKRNVADGAGDATVRLLLFD